MSLNLVITGASGFVGRSLLANPPLGFNLKLVAANDHQIITQGQVIKAYQIPTETWGPDTSILHLASARRGASAAKREKVDFQFTLRIAQKAAKEGARDFVFLSCLQGEAAPYKQRAEAALAPLFQNSSTRLIMLVLPNVYGPLGQSLENRLVRLAKAGVKLPLAHLGDPQPRLYVGNLTHALRLLFTQSIPSGVYWISDGDELAWGEFYDVVYQRLQGVQGCFRFAPVEWLLRLGEWLQTKEAEPPWLHYWRRLFAAKDVRGNDFAQAVGWQPPLTPLAALDEWLSWEAGLEEAASPD